MSKIAKVKQLAWNKWDLVFRSYSNFESAMKVNLPQIPCPKTGQGKTKFRLYEDWILTGGAYHNDIGSLTDGIEVVAWYENLTKGQALNVILDRIGGKISDVTEVDLSAYKAKSTAVRQLSPKDVADKQSRIKALALTSIPARQSDEVKMYLRSRGLKGNLDNLPEDLRYNDKVYYPASYRKQAKGCYYGAMLGLYKDCNDGNLTLHRTYLDKGKKAPEDKTKLIMSPPADIRGGYIHLDAPLIFKGEDDELMAMIGLSEGIETALAVREATGMAMRACYSSTLLSQTTPIIVPGVKVENTIVAIWVDKDVSGDGQKHAGILADKLTELGYIVEVYTPDYEVPAGKSSIDWLDVYSTYGSEVFPIFVDDSIALKNIF